MLSISEVIYIKFPCLVAKYFCNTDIWLQMEQEGINEYGEPLEVYEYFGKCNYQDKARRILTAEKKIIEITGTALFPDDICPQLPVITGGKAVVFGVERRIYQGKKARNPDGTINYTEILLV